MRDVSDGGAFHAFHRACGARFELTRNDIGSGAGRHGHERNTALHRKHLHRYFIEERGRTFHDRKAQRFHVEESRRARGAEVAVALAGGADDVADVKTRRGICAAHAAHNDRARVRLREKQRHGMRGVHRSDAGANDRDVGMRSVEPLAQERALELRCHAKKKIHGHIAILATSYRPTATG